MIIRAGIIYVGTCNKAGIPNVSPRTAYILTDDGFLQWCTWFRHKTFENERNNNHVSVAVVDPTNLTGFQMKGHVEHITDPSKIREIMELSNRSPRHANFNRMVHSQIGSPIMVQRFILEEVYSLTPVESSRNAIPIQAMRDWVQETPKNKISDAS